MPPLLIDTDPGMGTLGADPEDALAIMLAAHSTELTLAAITCVQGNVPLAHSLANVERLLELLGREDLPVAAGHSEPLSASSRHEQLRWLKEADARPRLFAAACSEQLQNRSADLISRIARQSPDGLVIAAIGPLTNIAYAIQADPELANLITRLVIMGGAYEVPGNISPVAEFNFWMDPDAAEIVLEAGVRPVLVGLDVCHRTRLTADQLSSFSGSALGTFVREACAPWLERLNGAGEAGFHLFDSLAVATALVPDLIETVPAYVQVDVTSGATQGSSIAWLPGRPSAWTRPLAGPNADVAVGVDLERFETIFQARVGTCL